MAYPNYYPNYYPQYQAYNTPQAPQAAQNANLPTNSIIWVQGEEAAKSYLVAPNNTVVLWDSEKQTIYLKSADNMGMPIMRTLDYTERSAQKPQNAVLNANAEYVTRDELKALQGDIERLKAMLAEKENDNA